MSLALSNAVRYFRNALVRANYTNMSAGIYMNTECLEKFFRNLLLGEQNALRNRHCHIRARNLPVNDRNLSVNKTERAVLELLLENNRYTYDEIAAKIDRNELDNPLDRKSVLMYNSIKSVAAVYVGRLVHK